MASARPDRIIHARAPIRINDIGAWTDTWFAGRGRVLNVAVLPGVEVQIAVFRRRSKAGARVAVHAENFGETFRMDPDRPRREPHGLLQFAVGSLPPGPDLALEIRIHSSVPAGISTGTSAAVCVALLGALNALRTRPLGLGRIGPPGSPGGDRKARSAERDPGPDRRRPRRRELHRNGPLSREPRYFGPSSAPTSGRSWTGGFASFTWALRIVRRTCMIKSSPSSRREAPNSGS